MAEDTATLDVISNGRLDVGFGRGSANYEYTGYNIDRNESQGMFQESINTIQALWTTPNYSHDGRYYKVNHVTLVPKPLQEPHPPIYIAATRTQATLEFVVSSGHPLIIGVVLDTVDAVVCAISSSGCPRSRATTCQCLRYRSSATSTSPILRSRHGKIPGRLWIGLWT